MVMSDFSICIFMNLCICAYMHSCIYVHVCVPMYLRIYASTCVSMHLCIYVSMYIHTYVMDGITEMACFLQKNRDLSIENGLRLVDCTLGPLLAFSGPVIIWPEKEFENSRLPLSDVTRRPGRCHRMRPRPFSPSRRTWGAYRLNCPEPYYARQCGAI